MHVAAQSAQLGHIGALSLRGLDSGGQLRTTLKSVITVRGLDLLVGLGEGEALGLSEARQRGLVLQNRGLAHETRRRLHPSQYTEARQDRLGLEARLHIYAALAEKERWLISQRTREALQAAKKKGVKLGGTTAKSIANRDAAMQRAEELRPIFAGLAGMSHRAMAAALNAMKVPTPASGQWHAVTVQRVLKRLG
jgi:hypothetical protein